MMMTTTTSISSDPMMRMQRQREKKDLQPTTKRRPKVSSTLKFVQRVQYLQIPPTEKKMGVQPLVVNFHWNSPYELYKAIYGEL